MIHWALHHIADTTSPLRSKLLLTAESPGSGEQMQEKGVLTAQQIYRLDLARVRLVEVDFPRHKELSAEQKKANQSLQEKYKIEGYPTIIVLNAEGKKLGDLGYMNSPKPFLKKLDELKKQST